jgi:hypothetical protein
MTEDKTVQFMKNVLLNGNNPRGKEAEKNVRWGLNEYLNKQLILHSVRNQRELLIAYEKAEHKGLFEIRSKDLYKKINKFLAIYSF